MKVLALIFFALLPTFVSAQVPAVPSKAKKFSYVDDMSGWRGCSSCTGNPGATYWFKQGISSPSMDGKSMKTYVKGSYGAWADNLFVKTLGDQTWAHHIEWSMNFLWNAPKIRQPNGNYVVQAIEFDARMIIGEFKYLFGTQCSYGHGTWDIWNNTKRYWQHTGIACQKWGPNTWHKVTWYLEIDNTHKYLHYVGLKVDDKQYWVNKWLPAGSVSYSKQFLVQFEQDTDRYGDPWYLWVDRLDVALW